MNFHHAGAALALGLLVAGCDDEETPAGADDGGVDAGVGADLDAGPGAPDAPGGFARCGPERAPLPPLVEDRRVYQQDTLGVWTVDVSLTDLDAFAAVNAGILDAEVPVIFTDGTFGAGVTAPNATMRIRGGASRQNIQKNYKIELNPDLGRWQNQKEINLNKHMIDLTRIRNKMAFDLLQSIPDLTSLRTQFVNLRINGEDYGLYTWIEEPDRRFLESHGLDPAGQLYKAFHFYFQPIPADTAADPEAFELFVENKANRDDAKFLRMNEAVNDLDRDFDEVLDQYFDRDNLATWLAVNVLLNNVDNRTQNFYLYSPSSCDGFYVLPWDYDGAWDFYTQLDGISSRARWRSGLSTWWGTNLWERFLMDPANVAAVDAKIRELAGSRLSDPLTAVRIASYRDLVLPFISRNPDLRHLPGHYMGHPPAHALEIWEDELDRITPTVSRFLAEYEAVIERPMPVHMGSTVQPGGVLFRWDESYDLQGDPIAYDLQVSRSAVFAAPHLVFDRDVGDVTSYLVSGLARGTYFWRVIIRDTAHPGAWQIPFNPYKLVVVP